MERKKQKNRIMAKGEKTMILPVTRWMEKMTIVPPYLLVGLVLTGCAMVGPDYTGVEADAPRGYLQSGSQKRPCQGS